MTDRPIRFLYAVIQRSTLDMDMDMDIDIGDWTFSVLKDVRDVLSDLPLVNLVAAADVSVGDHGRLHLQRETSGRLTGGEHRARMCDGVRTALAGSFTTRVLADARKFPAHTRKGAALSTALNAIDNHLIERLPSEDRRHLLAQCACVDLVLSQVLATPEEDVRYVYFPIDSFVSLLTVVSGEVGLEVGMVGREGMLGAHLSLGVIAAPLHALVQGPGSAWRCEAPAFIGELKRSAPLRKEIGLYVYVLMTQLATSAGCARYHEIGPRLARWLLMSQDRAHSDTFNMTQEFLGFMLGVRRVGITEAAGALQRAGLIEYQRGRLTVLDRVGLEAAACSCFAADRMSYARLLSSDHA